MLKLAAMFETFKSDVRGATAIEYGLIAAGIAVGISVVVFAFGYDLADLFSDMSTSIQERPA